MERLIKVDIFKITSLKSFDFIMNLLNMNYQGLKHALASIISEIACTGDGVRYLTHQGSKKDLSLIVKIIELLKEQDDSSLAQRFMISIL